MKNIAIFGSSRSGKTTLAKMISKNIPDIMFLLAMILDGLFKMYYHIRI